MEILSGCNCLTRRRPILCFVATRMVFHQRRPTLNCCNSRPQLVPIVIGQTQVFIEREMNGLRLPLIYCDFGGVKIGSAMIVPNGMQTTSKSMNGNS